MKEMKNMKKWMVALAALMLLLIPCVAMGEKETVFYCFMCREERNGTISDTYEYSDSNYHIQRIECNTCRYRGMGIGSFHTESRAATCQSPAYCDVCKSYYGDPEEHNWGPWTKADENQHVRTCQNSGCNQTQSGEHTGGNATCSTEGTCEGCGASYKDPNKHEYVWTDNGDGTHTGQCKTHPNEIISEKHSGGGGTCAEPGTCSFCGAFYYSDHRWDSWEAQDLIHVRTCSHCDKPQSEYHSGGNATCTTEGTCEVCNGSYKDPNKHEGTATTTYAKTSETQHTPTTTYSGCKHMVVGTPEAHTQTAPATCTAAAYCGDCKAYYGSTDPNAHNLVRHDAKAPTCTEIGWDAYQTCTRCSYTTYVEKPKQGHKLVYHSGRAPTCTTIGWNPYYTCARCDYTTYSPKGMLGHDPVNHAAKAPTCTGIGWDAYQTCSRCDYTTYVEKKALGHDLVNHAAKAPTCTAIGWDAYQTCSRCDYTTYAEKSALGHALVNHAAKAPTCTEIGWDAYQTCSRCDYSTYVEKSALGHALVNHAAKAPTCTEIGWSAYDTCSRCDYTTYNEKSALGHALVNHVAKAPTCTTIGWDVYDTCSRCDYSTYAELAALGHDYAAKTTRPSCTERGYTTHACTRCADSYRDAYVSALGHRYGEWIPNADGTNASACLRDCGDVRTADCATLGYALAAGDGRVELTLCPVCGEVSEIRLLDAEGKLVETLDGAVLLLIEDATAEAVTGTLPGGALVVRMGALESGDTLLSVAFESDGKLTRPSGQVNISLPAELLDGHTLALIGEDGTETPLTFEVEEDTASFTLDFTDSLTPACLIRLVPLA